MTGLMFLFLLISIAYMSQVERQEQRVRAIAQVYQDGRGALYAKLSKEFKPDLRGWGAELHDDLSIRFTEPSVQFDTASAVVKPRFAQILTNFFPRYVQILTNPAYRNLVSEVRIEGHTSSFWNAGTDSKTAYLRNMELSQARTRAVLEFLLDLKSSNDTEKWLVSKVTANGLSSSHLVKVSGKEDQQLSQRVEFRVRTNSDESMQNVIQATK